jgi:hypothetical protein
MKATTIETIPIPRGLAQALDECDKNLTRCSEIRTLMLNGETRILELAAKKISLESEAAAADVAVALGEGAPPVASKIRVQISAVEAECKQLSGAVPVYRQRLIDQHSALTDCQSNISSGRDFYAEKLSDAYAAEYQVAAEAYARVLAKGEALSRALRIQIPTPPAMPSTLRVEIGAAATRIGKALNDLDEAFRTVEKCRQSALRDSTRRKAFDPSATLEFLRQSTINGEVFQTGQRVLCSVIGASMGERLYAIRSVKVV